MGDQIRRKISKKLLSKQNRRRYASVFAIVALLVCVGVAAVLRQRGVAMTHEETVLDCHYAGDGAHTHTSDCYDEYGNLVCPLEEKELHIHDDSCYVEETELVCGLEEDENHTHTDDCYETTRTLVCDQEEVTEEHVHGPGCFTTITVDDGDTMPAQKFVGTLKERDEDDNEHVVLVVEANAPQGALPEESSMTADFLKKEDTEDIVELIEADANKDNPADATTRLAVKNMMGVRVNFTDAEGEDILVTSEDVQLRVSTALAQTAEHPKVARVLYDTETKEPLSAELLDKVSLVNQDPEDTSTGEENTLQFKTDASAAYVVVELEEVEVTPEDEQQPAEGETDPATEGEGENEGDAEGEGEEDAVPMPAQNFEQSVYNKNDVEIMRVNVAAPEGAFPEGTTMEVTRVKSADVEDVVNEAVSEPDVRRGVTHIQAVDIVFRNAEGDEIEPKAKITVTMTADRIANEDTNPMLVHVTDEGSGELVSTLDEEQLGERELEASNDALVFDSEEFSIYAIAYTVDFHFDVDGETRDYSIAGGDSLGLRELLSMLEIVDDDQLDSFISEVDTVTFSDSSLMHVAKVEQNTTAGELKAQLGLEVEQTAGTTKAQLEAFDAREFVAPDWALITLRPFDTHETLTITMKSGDVVIINVTDARLVANVLVAKGETYTITVVYDEEAQIPEGAELVVTPVKKASGEYQQYLSDSAEEMGVNADAVTFARFFDIRIEADGAKVEPKSPVQVQIEYANAMELGLEDSLRIVHFADEGTEVIKDLTVSNDKTEVSYLQSSFSVTGTIISGPNGGQAGDYMVLVNYPSGSGDYYIVNNDASLTKVNYNASAGTVDVENPMMWHVEGNNPNRHIYFHTEATGFQTNQTASDYYRRYLDPSAADALTEETNGSTQEGYVHVDLEDRPWGSGRWWNNDAQREDWDNHIVSHNAAERKTALNYYNRHIYTEPWSDSHHFGVELDEDGNPVRLIGNQPDYNGVEIVFAEARSVPGVYYRDHTVNHIDISISGSSEVTVPLAYGTYYYEDPSNPGNMLEYVVTGDTDLDLEQGDISILPEDMKRATIRAYDKNGNELDNAFVVTGYSSNTTTAYSTPQVRIEGRFKVADLNYSGGNDTNTCNARLNNVITYTVSAMKPITYALIDTEHGYGQLYEKQKDGSYKPLSITVDVNMTASFDYWDEDNECPPLQETVNGGHNSDYDLWRRGGIPTHNMSGMDFVLGGDADAAGANIVAVEITKMVVDENGHLIKMDKSYQQTFGIHESSVSQHGNGGIDSHLNVIGVNVPAYTEEYGEYDKYTPEPIHDKEVSVGTDGMGLVFDYDVVPGMYYITEDPSDIPDEIVDQDGETWTYLSTHIETENVWRNDGSVGKHESDVYTDKNSDTYRSVPEVAGAYTGNYDANQTDYLSSTFWGYDDDDDGTWKEMEFRNGFLQFFVYNVYTHGKSLSVEKRWEPENLVPQGAEVTLELMYRKRLTGHMVNGEPVPIPDEDIEPWPDPAEWLPVKNDPLFDEGIHSTLTLKASVTAKQNWKGAFVGLPANVVDGDGNIYEVDFTAEETAVKIPGPGKTVVDEDAIDITSQYKVTEVKTEPTPENEETSEGSVTVTNLKGGVIFEKKWLRPDGTTEYTPTNSPAVVTAQLRRQKTETTTTQDELVPVEIWARSNNYARTLIWSGLVRNGSSLSYSLAANGTSMHTDTVVMGGQTLPEGTVTREAVGDTDYTHSNGIKKSPTNNVYTLTDITGATVIDAVFADGTVRVEGTEKLGVGYYIVHEENTPNTTTDTNTVDEAVETITLSQSAGWTYTFESTDMASGWYYYINTDPTVGPVPTEIGVSENQFAFSGTPIVTTDDDGNTVYTCTNVSMGVELDVEKDWATGAEPDANSDVAVTVELQYKLRPADDQTASWSELAFVKDHQGANDIFDPEITTTLTLDSAGGWHGTFTELPTQVEVEGVVYDVDYTADETAVTIDGVDATEKYAASISKTPATPAEADRSNGTVSITNDKETITPTVEKVWDPVPTDANASVTVELHRYARITKGTIGVTLKDNYGAPIEGAVYELYENGQATGRTVTTNVNGKASFTDLGAGEYYLMQVSTPQEYDMEDCVTQTDTLTVEENVTTVQKAHFDMTNTSKVTAGVVTLTVEACEHGGFVPLEGAVVSLYVEGQDEPVRQGLVTDENGQLVVSNLPAGVYHFELTGVSDDYEMPASEAGKLSQGFTIVEQPGVVQEKTDTISHGGNDAIYQSARGTVTVTLTNATTNDPIDGVQFELKQGETVVATGTTADGGVIEFGTPNKLHAGAYTVHQVTKLDGLKKAADQNIEIEDINDNNQQIEVPVTNVVEGKGTVNITLTRKDNGQPISGAQFELQKNGEVVQNGTGSTDANGQLSFSNLDEGEYTIHQVSTIADYATAVDQSFEVVEGDGGQIFNKVFENEENKVLYTLRFQSTSDNRSASYQYFSGTTVTVIFDNGNPYYNPYDGYVLTGAIAGTISGSHCEFTVVMDGNKTVTVQNTGYSTWGNVVTDSMRLSPDPVNNGAVNNVNSLRSNASTILAVAVNRMVDPDTGMVLRAPAADDAPSGAPEEDAEATSGAIQVTDAVPTTAPTGYMEDSTFTPIQYTITSTDNWRHEFDPQDKYDADGYEYKYYIVETEHTPSDYWIESYEGDPLSSTGTITVTNKLRGELNIEKTFSGNAASELTAEQKAALTFAVTGPDNYNQTFTYGVDDAAHNATWTGDTLTITDLMPGTYTVVESGDGFVDGQQVPYLHATTMTVNSTTTTGNSASVVASKDGSTITVDNKYDTAELEITKTITGDISELPEGKTITFTITGEGLAPAGITKVYPTDFDANGKVKLTHADGIKPGATYTVTESGTGLDLIAYTRTTTVTSSSSTATFGAADGEPTGSAAIDATTGKGSVAFTNNYEKKTVDVPVSKAWVFAASSGVANTDGWPNGVEVSIALYQAVNDGTPAPAGVTTVLNASKTSDTFTNLPMYDANDDLITYSVVEEGVTGVDGDTFNTTVSGDATNGYTVTNTEKEAGLTIIKSFTGDALTDDEKADITFTVTGPGLPANGLTKTYAEFDENGHWVLTQADGIKKGKTYTVTESNETVAKYVCTTTMEANGTSAGEVKSTTVEVDGETGAGTVNIVNDYTIETTEVSGSKTWIDGGREHNNAEQITLKLYRKVEGADDSTYVLVTDGFTFAWDGNRYSFSNLDKYVKNHTPATEDDEKLYVYKVEEEAVTVSDGTTAISYEKTAEGYDLINTELTSVEAQKTWMDGDNDVTNTMTNATVTFELQKKVGEEGEWTTVEIAGQDNPKTLSVTDAASAAAWTASWTDLPKYEVVESEELLVQYRVVETAAAVLETSVKPDEDPVQAVENGAANVVNTLPKTQIEVTKQWKDGTVTNAERVFDEARTIGFTVYQLVGEEANVYTAYGENGHGTVTYTPATGNDPASWSTEVVAGLPTYVYNATSGQWAKASYYVVEDAVSGVTTSYLKGQTASDTAVGAVVTDADTDEGRTITIVNTDELLELDIIKVDADGMTQTLAGALFELQQIDPDSTTISVLGEAVYPTTTGADNKTGTDGEATFAGLAAGYYRVTEVETPAGYILPEDAVMYIHVEGGQIEFLERDEAKAPKQWTVMDEGNEKLEFEATADGAQAKVGNTAGSKLPHTGGAGASMIYAFGIALVMAAGFLFVFKSMQRGGEAA